MFRNIYSIYIDIHISTFLQNLNKTSSIEENTLESKINETYRKNTSRTFPTRTLRYSEYVYSLVLFLHLVLRGEQIGIPTV